MGQDEINEKILDTIMSQQRLIDILKDEIQNSQLAIVELSNEVEAIKREDEYNSLQNMRGHLPAGRRHIHGCDCALLQGPPDPEEQAALRKISEVPVMSSRIDLLKKAYPKVIGAEEFMSSFQQAKDDTSVKGGISVATDTRRRSSPETGCICEGLPESWKTSWHHCKKQDVKDE